MNYTEHYKNLINTRKSLNRIKTGETYYENHHIIPKCCGGLNNSENMVLLTFREHYIAHLLLSKMYDGEIKRKMLYALWRMSSTKSPNHRNERILSSSQYQVCREAQIEAKRNRIVTEETRKKISIGNTGKKRTQEMIDNHRSKIIGRTHTISDETRLKISESNRGRVRTQEMNNANSISQTGKKQSEETIQKKRDKLLGIPRSDDTINKILENNPLRKDVWCSNGETYKSIKSAAMILGLQPANISLVCSGKRKHTGGYKFMFI